MRAATGPRGAALDERLLVVDPSGTWICDARVGDLHAFLGPLDLLVLNDAFTWPASLDATTDEGIRLELRLAADLGPSTFRAIAFGDGDPTVPTEDRADPPPLSVGDVLTLARGGGDVVVVEVDADEPRWLAIRFAGAPEHVASRILRAGRPVQYAHVEGRLELWDVQTPFATRPMAFEMPSAGRPLALSLLRALRNEGVDVAFISHAAGLSSTGRASLDARLPLPERFDVPDATAAAVLRARERGGRVVAVGTTVVRALETAARRAPAGATIAAARGVTDLRLGPASKLRVVDAILSGIHEPGASHHELLQSFASCEVLDAALVVAEREGYLLHEFGDSMLLLPEGPRTVTTARVSGRVRGCPPTVRPTFKARPAASPSPTTSAPPS